MPITRSGVLYLQKDKFQLYSPFANGILEFRFAPNVVRDLDVINLEMLGNQVKIFITNGKIAPSNLIIVLCDNAYFVKDFVYQKPAAPQVPNQPAPVLSSKLTLEDLQKQAEQFIEHVPYDNVVSKTFPLQNGIRVCAANQDFYSSIKLVFEMLGFTVQSVLPGLIFGNNLSSRPTMDLPMANFILQKAGTFRQFDLLSQRVFEPQANVETGEADYTEADEVQDTKKSNRKRLIALSGILTSLIILLVIVYIQSQTPPSPPQQPALAQIPPQAAPPTNNTAVQAPATVGPLDSSLTQNLSVQIVNTSDSASLAQTLRGGLSKYTFKSITLQAQSNVGASGAVVSFSSNTSQTVRNNVLDEVRKVKSNITVQEKQESTIDITIILGK